MADLQDNPTEYMRLLNTISERLAKVQSDVNDIKVNGAQHQKDIDHLCREVKKINSAIYGNSGTGLRSQCLLNQERVDILEDKFDRWSKWILGILGAVIIDILIHVIPQLP